MGFALAAPVCIKVHAARLVDAFEELRRGDVRQAAEKVWGSAALAVKAYAAWREDRRLASHGELWQYKRKVQGELGEWVADAWAHASAMHTCYYEGWCSGEDMEEAARRVKRLVGEIARLVQVSRPNLF